MLVARLARRRVAVCLSGDGGDELFAGYERYHWAASVRRRLRLAAARPRGASLRDDAVPPAALAAASAGARLALAAPQAPRAASVHRQRAALLGVRTPEAASTAACVGTGRTPARW